MKPDQTKIRRSYLNRDFINSSEARPMRILSEYLHPAKVLQKNNIEDTIVFFGSARAEKPVFIKHKHYNSQKLPKKIKSLTESYRDATKLAYMITKWSKSLINPEEQKTPIPVRSESQKFYICSGGGPGIMEAANRGAYLAKGKSLGFNIFLPYEQVANPYISKGMHFYFHYFFMRKYWFTYLAKALIIFPGGFGTCDELFEVMTLIQTKKMNKAIPIILYNKNFWQKLINFDMFIEWGLIDKSDLEYIYFAENVQAAYDFLIKHIQLN